MWPEEKRFWSEVRNQAINQSINQLLNGIKGPSCSQGKRWVCVFMMLMVMMVMMNVL